MNKNEVKLIVTADTKGAAAAIQGFGSQLKSNWLQLSAMAAGAFFTIRKIYREFAAAAEREEKRMAFTNLAATFHSNADSIIADLKKMSGQSITTSRAIELAGKSMLSGLDPRVMPGLMEFAKTMSNVTGEKPADTFEDLTRAIITGNAIMLRRQMINVDFAQAQKDLAASLGGTTEQLNEQQTQYANLTAILEAASTITQRLGGDIQSMSDAVEANAAHLSESYEKLSNSFWKTFGQPAIFMLEVFAERLDEIRKIAHMIAFPFQKAGEWMEGRKWEGYRISEKAPPAKPAPASELAGAHRGATSLKDLGFTFDEQLGPGLQSMKDYTEETKKNLGGLEKIILSTKQLSAAREADIQMQLRQIDLAEQEFQLSKADAISDRVTKTRELVTVQEEYAKTLDKSLDPASWYAQQNAIDDTRSSLIKLNLELREQTGTFSEGVKQGWQQYLHDAKTSFQLGEQLASDAAAAMASSFSNMFTELEKGTESFGKKLLNTVNSFLNSILKAMNDIAAQAAVKGIFSIFGNLFSTPSYTSANGGTSSSAGSWGLASGSANPSPFGMPMRAHPGITNRGESSKSAANVSIHIENQTGKPVEMQQKSSKFDGEKYVVNVILKDLNSNGQLRTAFAGIK